VISAILRAQWLSMRLGGRRGAWLGVLTGLIWYGLWAFVSWIAFGFAREASGQELADYLPLVLLGVWIYWQAMPVLSASMGSSLEMRKLAVYPIPHERLFRVEGSRSRAGGGSGLGLAISRSIVEAHAGSIVARDSDLGGLCIEVQLPLGQASTQ